MVEIDRLQSHRLERQLDAQLVVTDELYLRTHFDDRLELDVTVVLTGGHRDLGRRDHVDVVLGDRVDVELRQRVAQRLLACHFGSEASLEQPPRRLARAESGDAHLAGQLAKCGVDCPLEFVGRHRDVELDLVALDRLDRALHKEEAVYPEPSLPRIPA